MTTGQRKSRTETDPFADREILVGVCGGIAAYKTCTVVSRLVQRGAGVTVVMTGSATRFVGPLTFEALSGRSVITDLWTAREHHDSQHIALTESADLFIVAPLTAHTMARMVCGLADDALAAMLLAAGSPVLLAPGMNERMWQHPATRANADALRERGCHFVGPCTGWLACRTVGEGRMAEPEAIVAAAEEQLAEKTS